MSDYFTYSNTILFHAPAGGAPIANVFDIQPPYSRFSLDTLYFDLSIRQPVPNIQLNLYTQITQSWDLEIFTLAGSSISLSVQDLVSADPAALFFNGVRLFLFKPGIYKMECLTISNILNFVFTAWNNDALINYNYQATFIIKVKKHE